jgi:hypothetical protein
VPAAPTGTNAYLEMTSPTIQATISYLHFRSADLSQTIVLQVLDSSTAKAFLSLAGGAAAPDSGTSPYGAVTVFARSCHDVNLAGATISSSNAGAVAVTAYLAGGIPSKTAAATDASGLGAIVNHAVGKSTVTVKLGATTLGTTDVIVRAGYLTATQVPPGP